MSIWSPYFQIPKLDVREEKKKKSQHDHNQGDGHDEDVSHHGRNRKHLQVLEKGERNGQHTVDDSPEPHLTEDGVVAHKAREQVVPSNLVVKQESREDFISYRDSVNRNDKTDLKDPHTDFSKSLFQRRRANKPYQQEEHKDPHRP